MRVDQFAGDVEEFDPSGVVIHLLQARIELQPVLSQGYLYLVTGRRVRNPLRGGISRPNHPRVTPSLIELKCLTAPIARPGAPLP
jgi:hypothetical protein